MPMDAHDIEAMIKAAIPDAEVTIRDLAGDKTLDNAIWTYETPFPAMAEITGHLAFYPDKVKIEEVG